MNFWIFKKAMGTTTIEEFRSLMRNRRTLEIFASLSFTMENALLATHALF